MNPSKAYYGIHFIWLCPISNAGWNHNKNTDERVKLFLELSLMISIYHTVKLAGPFSLISFLHSR